MIHQSSTRSTKSSSSSNSSCGSTKSAETTTVPNLTLYGSPAPRSAHRTSLGAMRVKSRQKSIKPTTPPPSTPDLHLDLGSLAESDSECDSSIRKSNLPMADIPGQSDKGYLRNRHSYLPLSGVFSSYLSYKPNTKPPYKKSNRRINHKSKVSQLLFHSHVFERNNKHNSNTEAAYSMPFSKKFQHKHTLTEKKNFPPNTRKSSSRTVASDTISVNNSQEAVYLQYNKCTESNLPVSIFEPVRERPNTVSTLSASSNKVAKCFNFYKEMHHLQKELSYQTFAAYSISRLHQTNSDKNLICGNNEKLGNFSIVSDDESHYKSTAQNLSQTNAETSDGSTIPGFAPKEKRNFQLFNKKNDLLEKECENMAASNSEITINEMHSKDHTISSNSYELSTQNTHTDLCNSVYTNDINVEKTSEQQFVPKEKGKSFERCTWSKYDENVDSTSVDLDSNHTKITDNEKDVFSARQNSTNCVSVCTYDYNRASDEPKEEQQISLLNQNSLGRERKNSDASLSSYHSSTYSTLSDSNWGCNSDTYESYHSEEVFHRKHSFNIMNELIIGSPRRNPLDSLSSETHINPVSESISENQMNQDFELTRIPSEYGWSPDNFQTGMKEKIQPQNKNTSLVDNGKDSISDEIFHMKNDSFKNDASQTRQSSSTGVTGSIAVDTNVDVHYSGSEHLFQESIPKEKENVTKAFSITDENYSEERAVEEKEKEIISVATSEELCLVCSYNLKMCRCLPFTKIIGNNRISENNSDNEHTQNITENSNSFPSFVRNDFSAPGFNSEYERRTRLLLQRLGCSTSASDVFLSADEVMEVAMHARQLVHVLEKALDRTLSLKMMCVCETVSQSKLQRSQSVPEFFSKSSITDEEHVPVSVENNSLIRAYTPKDTKWKNSDANSGKGQENAFTDSELFSLPNIKQNNQKNYTAKRMNTCHEKCYCSGPKLLNISPQELQHQKELLRPVDKKPKAFTVIKDMASIFKSVISHRRDIIVPPEDGAYYISRSVSEWSIDE